MADCEAAVWDSSLGVGRVLQEEPYVWSDRFGLVPNNNFQHNIAFNVLILYHHHFFLNSLGSALLATQWCNFRNVVGQGSYGACSVRKASRSFGQTGKVVNASRVSTAYKLQICLGWVVQTVLFLHICFIGYVIIGSYNARGWFLLWHKVFATRCRVFALLSVVAWEHHRVFAIYNCLGTPNTGFGEVANDAALCAHAEIYLRIAVMICVVAAPLHEL